MSNYYNYTWPTAVFPQRNVQPLKLAFNSDWQPHNHVTNLFPAPKRLRRRLSHSSHAKWLNNKQDLFLSNFKTGGGFQLFVCMYFHNILFNHHEAPDSRQILEIFYLITVHSFLVCFCSLQRRQLFALSIGCRLHNYYIKSVCTKKNTRPSKLLRVHPVNEWMNIIFISYKTEI